MSSFHHFVNLAPPGKRVVCGMRTCLADIYASAACNSFNRQFYRARWARQIDGQMQKETFSTL